MTTDTEWRITQRRIVSELPPDRPISDTSAELRRTFIAYVSGRLASGESDAFEQSMLSDGPVSEQIAALQEDLLEDYAAGSLEPADHESLRRWVMASERRRDQVQLARLMLLRSQQKPRSNRSTWYWLATAAAGFLAVAGLYLWHRIPVAKPVATVQAPIPSGPATRQATTPPDVILLAAERLRGPSTQTGTVYVVHDQSPVRIQVVITNAAASSRYNLVLHSSDDRRNPWPPIRFEGLAPQTTSGLSYVEATLSPGRLPSGKYAADVTSSSGSFTTAFRVRSEP